MQPIRTPSTGGWVLCVTTAVILVSRRVLLANLSLSRVHVKWSDQSICLNLHIHILPTVWSYGVPDSPSYSRTSPRRKPRVVFVIQAVLCIHPSIAALRSSEVSDICGRTHTRPGHWLWITFTEPYRTAPVVKSILLDTQAFIQNIHSLTHSTIHELMNLSTDPSTCTFIDSTVY